MSVQYQNFESLQLVVSQALGGEVEDDSPASPSRVRGTEITNMNQLISAVQTIGGRVGG